MTYVALETLPQGSALACRRLGPGGYRGGRRIPLLGRAVKPTQDRLGADARRDLVLALMAVSGPEPDFVLRDIARLDNAEIDRITEQALRDIVAAHVARA